MISKFLIPSIAALAIAAPAVAATVTTGGVAVPGAGLTSAEASVTVETFDPSGTPNFVTVTGDFSISNTSVPSLRAAPAGDETYYLSVPADAISGVGTVTFPLLPTQEIEYLGLYWGSIDDYNTLYFYDASNNLINLAGFGTEITGSEIRDALTASGDQTAPGANKYINIFFAEGETFSYLKLDSTERAFEVDNLAWRVGDGVPVPAPAMVGLLGLGFAALAAARRRKA